MNLEVSNRNVFGKSLSSYRKKDKIPGIVYGKHLSESVSIFFDRLPFIKIYEEKGYSMPINLVGDGINELVLIYDIQVDPVKNSVLHVDFHAVKADEKTEAEVSIVLVGEAPVEKQGLGKIELVKDSVLVEGLPNDLPQNISVDLSKMESIGDGIFVKDLLIDNKISIKDSFDLPIVAVVEIEDEKDEEELDESEEEIQN
ncbi:50S ribosomal protein L25 [Candidatus Vampirococcus lugosii]|uniref:Large ribosomal subunit protein bL25 n=1 Tax=Candidatus Vampirococcus lugosii TaxID=2789015 RepID=A0ABS5QLG5_9BACT|nr:50S ribosomal protein L25 [Candidatus Vampirococcus lugosii]MBS8121983.1 ribosomal 5S rRNA E-loop binding protein Ctc/L25/TL5 [Candidatus Vampirococcus lugosii]